LYVTKLNSGHRASLIMCVISSISDFLGLVVDTGTRPAGRHSWASSPG
jgi:hypothetical protein